MNSYDLIVIGGGAAGIMAAISAKRHNSEIKVAIIDRTFALGRKILVCGAGRCNITNAGLSDNYKIKYHTNAEKIIEHVFEEFSYEDIVKFFGVMGITVYEEQKNNLGKIFPNTDEAKTVTTKLIDELEFEGIDIHLNTECTEVIKKNSKFHLITHKVENQITTKERVDFIAKRIILSAGGKTYPALGSNGSGYTLAESFGHTIVQPVPSGVSLEGKDQLAHLLQRVKLNAKLTSIIEGKRGRQYTGDLIFTNYGISGTATLNISRDISIYINRNMGNICHVEMDFVPEMSQSELKEFIYSRRDQRGSSSIENHLIGIFSTKFPSAFLRVIGVKPESKISELTEKELDHIILKLKTYTMEITGTRGWNEAEFTAGGIEMNEVTENLESIKQKNLFLCGEILNVDGDIGGYNLSWAWSSGWVAGKFCANSL